MQHWEIIAQVTFHMWPHSATCLAQVSYFAKISLDKANDPIPSGAGVNLKVLPSRRSFTLLLFVPN